MALTTAVMVGEAKEWLHEVASKAAKLQINAGHEPNADIGPVISPEAKSRISGLIEGAKKEGANILVSFNYAQVPNS